jgi:Homeodomain-like domain
MPKPSRSTNTKQNASRGKKVRARRDFEALTARRMRAAGMFARGKRQVDVVVELGVSAWTASRWHRDWLAGGREALAGADRAGRRRWLSDGQPVWSGSAAAMSCASLSLTIPAFLSGRDHLIAKDL